MTNLSAEFVTWCNANAVGDEGEKATEWWRQRALQLAAQDNSENDCTDYAHPAWWRGYDCATAMAIQEVTEILDGDGTLNGTCNEPWESLRRRLVNRCFDHFESI